MEIVVHGRNVEVPDHFRQHVWDKVSASDRFDGKL
jgi:ribosome-associated translation inhibitor RaiA